LNIFTGNTWKPYLLIETLLIGIDIPNYLVFLDHNGFLEYEVQLFAASGQLETTGAYIVYIPRIRS
jgi:hypothetical protein